MTAPSPLVRLNAHRAWANALYVGWLAEQSSPEEYCLKMLSHVLRAEEAWLARLRGEVPGNLVWSTLPPEGLEPLRVANDAGMEAALDGDPMRVFRYSRFDGTAMESTAADILTHVCTHGVYHRGQIAAHAARSGLPKVPVTDFIAYARLFP